MAIRSAPSLNLLTAAIVLPLLLLVILAVAGIRAQTKAARETLAEEADREAKVAANFLKAEYETKLVSFPRFPDPPAPGESSADDAVLDGQDVPALISLRDKKDAGNSPAGLPRRALAALRLLDLAPEAQQASEVADLVTMECPSVLTEIALGKLGSESRLSKEWRNLGNARRLLEKHPAGGWIEEDGQGWWVKSTDDKFEFISPERNREALGKLESLINPLFSIHVSTRTIPPRSAEAPLLFGTAPLEWGQGLRVEALLKSREAFLGGIRRQELWTFSLLAIAVGISAAGLFFIRRTLLRERKLNEMKSQFVASVSHELRAPVASIRLMADALEEDKLAPETAKEFHRLIAREGARLSTLVGNVLDHARIEQGRRIWKKEPCDLAALVADTVRVMEPLAKEKGITLSSTLLPVEATVDSGAIQQALVNLLDNAIKFSPAGSGIGISLSIHDESRNWELRVRDEGVGIPKNEQVRIFERFYRPGDELRRETQGTGIGLSLVKAIAEAHGGAVLVESEPGKGSTFILRIPISS